MRTSARSRAGAKYQFSRGFIVIVVRLELNLAAIAMPEWHEPSARIMSRRPGKSRIQPIERIWLPDRPNTKKSGICHQNSSHDFIEKAAVDQTKIFQ